MHELLFYVAAAWLAALFVVNVAVAARHASVLARILAVDTASLLVIAGLLLLLIRSGEGHYLDAAVVIALLSFVETIVAARFHSGGKEWI